MFAYALRRAIWAIPTLFGVSLVVFVLTTLLPDPALDEGGSPADVAHRLRLDELRRARFLDLPRFVNVAPTDVRTGVDACIVHLVADDDDAELCEIRLAQIGGAGLPYLLPHLDTIPPTPRGRIAMALAPIARRMGVGDERELASPSSAALFWERFWEDRSVDFTAPAVHREVDRLVKRGSDLREEELRFVDTFALEQLVEAMRLTKDRDALVRLTRLASHVTERDVTVKPDDDAKRVRAVVSDWQSWWYVHDSDYVALQGGAKVTASIAQTRYAKWVLGAATGQLGLSTSDGEPVFDKLLARAPVTLGMAFLALLLSAAIAVPLGVLAAWRRGHFVDHTTALLLLAFYSLPTFLVAELLATFGRASDAGFVLPVVALATVSLSVMTQQQRASMIEALGQDYIRVARAKGARTLRVAVVHALRNALVPTITLAGVQFPALVGAAFVVEEVFGIHGMGWETLRAIESRDAAWIVAVTLLCAVVTTACLVTSDVAYGLLDPRVREQQIMRRRTT
ncbi:MAG: Dipeptide transport system permease protein DppB [Labilithrix sp.]|nr:Dipeptide transport system permease protein DppB [Labilithrix sp.]